MQISRKMNCLATWEKSLPVHVSLPTILVQIFVRACILRFRDPPQESRPAPYTRSPSSGGVRQIPEKWSREKYSFTWHANFFGAHSATNGDIDATSENRWFGKLGNHRFSLVASISPWVAAWVQKKLAGQVDLYFFYTRFPGIYLTPPELGERWWRARLLSGGGSLNLKMQTRTKIWTRIVPRLT